MSGALSGLKILDLTSVLMGPFATQILADMGADVIKIEPPAGDTVRGIGPMRNPGMGSNFLHVNRNKRSLVLPSTLSNVCVKVDMLDLIAQNSMHDRLIHSNPRKINGPEDVRRILDAAW